MLDKCYFCFLALGDYSIKIGMLLRDIYQLLFSFLQENMKDFLEFVKGNSFGFYLISYIFNI